MTSKSSSIPKSVAKPRKQATAKRMAVPTREEISRLAEKYWENRGRPQGSPEEDWLRAEEQLRGKAS